VGVFRSTPYLYPAEMMEYHYVITIRDPGSDKHATEDGIYVPVEGDTYKSAFNTIRDDVVMRRTEYVSATVVYFNLIQNYQLNTD
jgi:hypothetical protein